MFNQMKIEQFHFGNKLPWTHGHLAN